MKYLLMLFLFMASSTYAFDYKCSSATTVWRDNRNSFVISVHNGGGTYTGALYHYARFWYDKDGRFERIDPATGTAYRITSQNPLTYQVKFQHKLLGSPKYTINCLVRPEALVKPQTAFTRKESTTNPCEDACRRHNAGNESAIRICLRWACDGGGSW